MKVVRISDVKAQEATSQLFRGKVTTQRLIGEKENEIRAAVINFSRGAVNIWHTHTFDQVLVVTKGTGIVATETEEITVTSGTVIVFPAGEKHWHGAAKDSAFSHIAIMPPGTTSF